jgi:hypothetical protein
MPRAGPEGMSSRVGNKGSAEDRRAPEGFELWRDNRRANDFGRIRTNRRLERFGIRPARRRLPESHRGRQSRSGSGIPATTAGISSFGLFSIRISRFALALATSAWPFFHLALARLAGWSVEDQSARSPRTALPGPPRTRRAAEPKRPWSFRQQLGVYYPGMTRAQDFPRIFRCSLGEESVHAGLIRTN